MEDLNNKQREIIKLAFKSKDSGLRRRAIETIVTARYQKEFLTLMKSQRHRHPGTGNMVTWNSLPSQAQSAKYRDWKAEREEAARNQEQAASPPSPPAGGGGGGGDASPGQPQRGHKHAGRKELRSTRGRKAMTAHAAVGADDDLRKLAIPKRMTKQTKKDANKHLDEATYEHLDKMRKNVEAAFQEPRGPYMQELMRSGYSRKGLKNLHQGLKKRMEDTKGKKFHRNVLDVANRNDLEEEDADVLRDFREDKPGYGRHHTWPELMQKFLHHRLTTPETRERMKGMSIDDFKKMYLSILKDEDEEVADLPGGRVASEDGTLRRPVSIFDPPSVGEKTATLTPEGRQLVRAAFRTKDAAFRAKFLKVARSALITAEQVQSPH